MRRGLILAAWPLLLSCGGADDAAGPTLEVVSDQITFKSVESLGAHHMLATVSRTDLWDDGGQDDHEETAELAWNNWDSFHMRRVVNGATLSEIIVEEGRAYSRSKGSGWQTEIDAEPARLQVQTTWNVWATAMDLFSGRVQYTEGETSVVDGRPARRFAVVLSPLAQGQRIRSGSMTPVSIEGEVWLDEGTAVRLSANVRATATRKGLSRTIHIHLRRSGVGQAQTITPPAAPVRSPGEILRQRAQRPTRNAPRSPARAGKP